MAAPPPFERERSRRMATSAAPEASRVSHLLLGNDSWELFQGIPKHYSLRTRVRLKMRVSSAGYAWELGQTAFAVVASALYVVQAYNPEFDTDAFDLAALIVFSVDYLLNFYVAENRWWFVISFMSIMDIVTILPSAIDRLSRHDRNTNSSVGNSFPFLRFIRVLRLLRLTRLIRAAGSRSTSAVQKQIHTIVLLITCIIFISAGVFHAVESANRDVGQPQITFGDSLYFLMVTMATVGYGDITPLTPYGKAAAVAVIILAFTLIPAEVTRLTQLMSLQSQFRRFHHPSAANPHILVVGHITDARILLDFFKEMYHPDRQVVHIRRVESSFNEPLTDPPCVLMGPDEPSEGIVNLLDHPLLQNRVTYIKGSVMSEEDLCRVGADAARACFVLVPKSSNEVHKIDAETVLRLLAIRNYNADLEIYTQMVSSSYYDYISEVDADHVLCINEIKLRLMAKSCLCPGLVTLVSNLFRSSSMSTSGTIAQKGWEKEYIEGVAMEVYATKLPPIFHGLSFAQACELLYDCFRGEVILMGVFDPSAKTSLNLSMDSDEATLSPYIDHQLPTLNLHPIRPVTCHGSPVTPIGTKRGRSSRMYMNPGHDVRMAQGQIVYVFSESKRLTHTISISQHVNHWLSEGHSLPEPVKIQEIPETSVPPIQVEEVTPKLNFRTYRRRDQRSVLLEEAVHPVTQQPITNHIIIVSDLEPDTLYAFLKLLRLRHINPGRRDYHTILFLSWASTANVSGACKVLQRYDDVFLMTARHINSKTEFIRANILRAARCVLLSDRSSITQFDGETVDAQTIFHYLAILSIQSEIGADTTSGLMPIVELTMPRTMKILDSALSKRTVRSYLQRQKLNSILRKRQVHQKEPRKGRAWTKRLIQQMVRNGADDISSLTKSLKLRKTLQVRHSTIRQQDATTNRSASFDATETALLPFFAAGYGFSDDIFDNMLCQSYFTPGLIRFIYSLLFTENGRTHTRQNSTSKLTYKSRLVCGTDVEDFTSDVGYNGDACGRGVDDSSDDDDDDDDCDDDDGDEDDDFGNENGDDNRDEEGDAFNDTSVKCYGDIVAASSIIQIPVPHEFVARSFGDLFRHLLACEQVVAIALYRGTGVPFSLPYVATGPSTETILIKDDFVFVLAQPAARERIDQSFST